MATWNQSINGGGMLAGIGGNNVNAPQASDANAALSFIRQNNEAERAGENNIGLQGLNGLAGNLQLYKQAQQAERQKEFQKAYGNAFSAGDRNAMRSLAAQYPDQVEAVRSGMKFVDEDQRSTVGNLATGARLAASSPEAMGSWLKNNATDLRRVGLDPVELSQTHQADPKGFAELADHLGMAALGPDQYFAAQDKIVGQQQNQQKIDETARSNLAGEAAQRVSNGIAQQNVNIRKMELEDKKYDRQIARETNDLKLADLKDKRQQNQMAIEQGKRDKIDNFSRANDTLDQTLDTASRVLNSPGFDKYFGVSMTKLPGIGTLPGTDAADTEALVNTLSSQGFLTSIQQMKGMGALSDAEGKKISSAIASLDSKQSDKSARAAVKTIISVTQAAKDRLQRHAPDIAQTLQTLPASQPAVQQQAVQQQAPAPAQQAGGYSSLWGD